MGNQDEGFGGRGGFDMEKRPFNYDENSGPGGYNIGRANGPGGRPPSGRRGPSQNNASEN